MEEVESRMARRESQMQAVRKEVSQILQLMITDAAGRSFSAYVRGQKGCGCGSKVGTGQFTKENVGEGPNPL